MYLIIYIDCFRRFVRDVVFVIDTNSIIGSTRFQLVREVIENITINIKVNSPETLFGLITFNDYARLEFDISKHTDLSTLLPAINPGLPYHGGNNTNISSALNLLLSGSVSGGLLQLRDRTTKIAIVITGSTSSSYSSLYSAANSLHAENIFDVYAIGIGSHSYSELQLIASDPSFILSRYLYSNLTARQLVQEMNKPLCSGK